MWVNTFTMRTTRDKQAVINLCLSPMIEPIHKHRMEHAISQSLIALGAEHKAGVQPASQQHGVHHSAANRCNKKEDREKVNAEWLSSSVRARQLGFSSFDTMRSARTTDIPFANAGQVAASLNPNVDTSHGLSFGGMKNRRRGKKAKARAQPLY